MLLNSWNWRSIATSGGSVVNFRCLKRLVEAEGDSNSVDFSSVDRIKCICDTPFSACLVLKPTLTEFVDRRDLARVVGADDGRWVALGSRDRKVRFADSAASGGVAESGHAGAAERAPGGGAAKTGAGSQGGVVVSGHAGRVTCMVVNTRGRYVLTGSYDTSIR